MTDCVHVWEPDHEAGFLQYVCSSCGKPGRRLLVTGEIVPRASRRTTMEYSAFWPERETAYDDDAEVLADEWRDPT